MCIHIYIYIYTRTYEACKMTIRQNAWNLYGPATSGASFREVFRRHFDRSFGWLMVNLLDEGVEKQTQNAKIDVLNSLLGQLHLPPKVLIVDEHLQVEN